MADDPVSRTNVNCMECGTMIHIYYGPPDRIRCCRCGNNTCGDHTWTFDAAAGRPELPGWWHDAVRFHEDGRRTA